MGKQPFVSHAVNGYSRYDVPESKAFSCTPGLLYPVRVDFINARDRVSISQGIDVRSNPLAVPSFNPYTVRLHRFWVPLQLYHPELRTNSNNFDMNDLSLNWIPTACQPHPDYLKSKGGSFSNSLYAWLRIGFFTDLGRTPDFDAVELSSLASDMQWANADSYLAYWDIVRNYYSYSQWGLYSVAWPGSFHLDYGGSPDSLAFTFQFADTKRFFSQQYNLLSFLDAYFESQFYPSAVASRNKTYNRSNLFSQILLSKYDSSIPFGDGYVAPLSLNSAQVTNVPGDQFALSPVVDTTVSLGVLPVIMHPLAVVPSNPDRFSRALPVGTDSAVSMSGVSTIPQLAIASRLQEYKDLLGAGGSRYSDWLETFFASRIEHVDRPKLLFSASQTVNVQVVMNQGGSNNFTGDASVPPLGQQGGSISFNTQLGRRQSYYFREPGYMIDMLSIRPVYYWSGIRPDYLNYKGSDYFNPIYNDIGYQGIPASRFSSRSSQTSSVNYIVSNEPCFNEFRSSYDETLGQLNSFFGSAGTSVNGLPLYSYWVQQRVFSSTTVLAGPSSYVEFLFVDLDTVNSPFFSDVEDNFFVNLSYSVSKKNLVNKTFATRLSNR